MQTPPPPPAPKPFYHFALSAPTFCFPFIPPAVSHLRPPLAKAAITAAKTSRFSCFTLKISKLDGRGGFSNVASSADFKTLCNFLFLLFILFFIKNNCYVIY